MKNACAEQLLPDVGDSNVVVDFDSKCITVVTSLYNMHMWRLSVILLAHFAHVAFAQRQLFFAL